MVRDAEYRSAGLPDMCRDRLLHYAGMLDELARGIIGPVGRSCFTQNADREQDEREIHSILQRQQLLALQKQHEEREIMSHSLKETARVVKDLAQNAFQLRPMEERKGRKLCRMLKTEGFTAENPCYYSLEKEREGIVLTLYSAGRVGIRTEIVADMLSVMLDRPFQASVQSPCCVDDVPRSFLFVPEAPRIMLTGYAKATKEGECVSGDNLAVLERERGRVQLLLSDGTGSGATAGESSGWVLDMMDRLVESGYDIRAGADLVNAILLYSNNAVLHPTLDICDIDLHNGSCCFFKAGGAVSYLKRGDKIREIPQKGLPLGFFNDLQMEGEEIHLRDGDYLIMVSDGVTEVVESGEQEAAFAATLSRMSEQNPQVIAEKLLQLIIRMAQGHIPDDMTILVAGVWEKGAIP
ncbi:MAG: SpoIIE family protein phosphatase [Lachnospiraceae bacterium]|nr:SpoIIE family protein phosphatase [Lachnospiraceae bacterium]